MSDEHPQAASRPPRSRRRRWKRSDKLTVVALTVSIVALAVASTQTVFNVAMGLGLVDDLRKVAASALLEDCGHTMGLRKVDLSNATITPSSVLPADNDGRESYTYEAEHVRDGYPGTAWSPDSSWDDEKPSLKIDFAPRTVNVRLICIINGYRIDKPRFDANAAIKLVNVVSDAGAMEGRLGRVPRDPDELYQELPLVAGPTGTITLEINDSWPGEDGQDGGKDICLSEVQVWESAAAT